MRTVFLVPRRNDDGLRDQLWAWCRARWESIAPDIAVYEGHHTDGPFNRSAAINKAARVADTDGAWDVGVVIDSDVFLSVRQLRAAIASAYEGKVTWAHRRWRGIHRAETERFTKDPDSFGDEPAAARDMDLLIERTTPISWSCCVAVPRQTFDAMGGFDERFKGWGFEDGAWSALVRGLHPWDRIPGDIYHWWHPRSDERIVAGESAQSASPDYVRNALLGRRYMVAALRDHRVGDQPGEERLSAEMAELHVSNLTHDDMRFLNLARRLGMREAKQWATWWPTLDELQAGAIEYSAQERIRERTASRSVTLVVHSGGDIERWPERREYLRQTLASLTAHVAGPIVQRVVYSDWGDAAPDLADIAGQFGFYVAGDGHHGYTSSMQRMWGYLGRRAVGQYVFQAEDDFLFDRDIELTDLIDVAEARPNLTQIALLRHPAYQSEIDKGGVLGWPSESFRPVSFNGHTWLEHRNFWTANPSLFRRSLVQDVPWPSGKSSERVFADQVFRDTNAYAGFWGAGDAYITHLGSVRAGSGY
jgi:hypothetical protein